MGYEEQYVDMETTRYGFTLEEEIAKHSKQLIDLIEVRRFCKWISYIRTNIQRKHYVRN